MAVEELPLSELLDRASIHRIKSERLEGDEAKRFEQEFNRLWQIIEAETVHGNARFVFFGRLYQVNADLWDTECAIRTGTLESNLTQEVLAKIGTLALAVRDLNKKRCGIKNEVCDLTNTGVKECKVNYGTAK